MAVDPSSEIDIDPFQFAIGMIGGSSPLDEVYDYLWEVVGGYPYAIRSVYLFACHHGHIELLDALENIANRPEHESYLACDTYGARPFHVAIKNGHLDIVRYLLEKHPSVVEQTMSPESTSLFEDLLCEDEYACVAYVIWHLFAQAGDRQVEPHDRLLQQVAAFIIKLVESGDENYSDVLCAMIAYLLKGSPRNEKCGAFFSIGFRLPEDIYNRYWLSSFLVVARHHVTSRTLKGVTADHIYRLLNQASCNVIGLHIAQGGHADLLERLVIIAIEGLTKCEGDEFKEHMSKLAMLLHIDQSPKNFRPSTHVYDKIVSRLGDRGVERMIVNLIERGYLSPAIFGPHLSSCVSYDLRLCLYRCGVEFSVPMMQALVCDAIRNHDLPVCRELHSRYPALFKVDETSMTQIQIAITMMLEGIHTKEMIGFLLVDAAINLFSLDPCVVMLVLNRGYFHSIPLEMLQGNVNKPIYEGTSLFHYYMMHCIKKDNDRDASVVRFLDADGDLVTSNQGGISLQVAQRVVISCSSEFVLQILHERPYLCTIVDQNESILLHAAAVQNSAEVFNFVKEHTLPSHLNLQTNGNGLTIGHLLAKNCHLDLDEIDLHGIHWGLANQKGAYPFWLAIQAQNVQAINVIARENSGINWNVLGGNGETLAHQLVRNFWGDFSEITIMGIDWKMSARSGKTPAAIAIELGNLHAMQFLTRQFPFDELRFPSRIAKTSSPLHYATICGRVDIIDLLLEDMDYCSEEVLSETTTDRETLYHLAAKQKNIVSRDALLVKFCDADLPGMNRTCNHGHTPLYLYAKSVRPNPLVFMRLKYEERIWEAGACQRTPYQLALSPQLLLPMQKETARRVRELMPFFASCDDAQVAAKCYEILSTQDVRIIAALIGNAKKEHYVESALTVSLLSGFPFDQEDIFEGMQGALMCLDVDSKELAAQKAVAFDRFPRVHGFVGASVASTAEMVFSFKEFTESIEKGLTLELVGSARAYLQREKNAEVTELIDLLVVLSKKYCDDATTEQLNIFLERIKTKEAYLGTPPAENTAALDHFYKTKKQLLIDWITLLLRHESDGVSGEDHIRLQLKDLAEASTVCATRTLNELRTRRTEELLVIHANSNASDDMAMEKFLWTYARNWFFTLVTDFLDEIDEVYHAHPGSRVHFEAYLHHNIGVKLGIISPIGLEGIDDSTLSDGYRVLLDQKVRAVLKAFSPELLVAQMMREKEVSECVVKESTGKEGPDLYDEEMEYLTLHPVPVLETLESADLMTYRVEDAKVPFDTRWIAFVQAGMEHIKNVETGGNVDETGNCLISAARGLAGLLPSQTEFNTEIGVYLHRHRMIEFPSLAFFASREVQVEIESMVARAETNYFESHHPEFMAKWQEVERAAMALFQEDEDDEEQFISAIRNLVSQELDGDLFRQIEQLFTLNDFAEVADFFSLPGNLSAAFHLITELIDEQNRRIRLQQYRAGIADTFHAMDTAPDEAATPVPPSPSKRRRKRTFSESSRIAAVQNLLPEFPPDLPPQDGTTPTPSKRHKKQ